MLDKFRETAITWDKANRKVYEPLRVSAGDNKGRKLSVQVVNDGVIENLSGASLSFFWETKDKVHKGLDAFTAVDASKGEFEIYYTTGMLSNEGTLNANLVLVDASGRIVSEPFTITIFKGIDDDAIQSEDSFTALTQALIDISNLEQNYAPRLNDLTAQLQHMEIKVFEELPSTSQLKEGEFGFVIDVAQQQYDDLNLSFEKLNHLGFPRSFITLPSGGGTKIVESFVSPIPSTDSTLKSVKVAQIGGVDGSSSYAKLKMANIIPLNGDRKVLKSDLTNFRFSVKPLSTNCYDGAGLHMGSASVSFRGSNNEIVGQEVSIHFIYDKFPIPANSTGNKVVLDEWTVVKWDLQEACRKIGINFDLVYGVVVTFNAYTNHSSASCEFLVDDISFGV